VKKQKLPFADFCTIVGYRNNIDAETVKKILDDSANVVFDYIKRDYSVAYGTLGIFKGHRKLNKRNKKEKILFKFSTSSIAEREINNEEKK